MEKLCHRGQLNHLVFINYNNNLWIRLLDIKGTTRLKEHCLREMKNKSSLAL